MFGMVVTRSGDVFVTSIVHGLLRPLLSRFVLCRVRITIRVLWSVPLMLGCRLLSWRMRRLSRGRDLVTIVACVIRMSWCGRLWSGLEVRPFGSMMRLVCRGVLVITLLWLLVWLSMMSFVLRLMVTPLGRRCGPLTLIP